MQHDIDKPRVQTTLVNKEAVQSRYATVLEAIFETLKENTNEVFYLRHEWEDVKKDIFDLNELVGRLATKIEEWVGVAEE